jgi:hypothetical protein
MHPAISRSLVDLGKLFEREGMTIDRNIELTSELRVKKWERLPSKGLEEEVRGTVRKEVNIFLGKNLLQEEKEETI